MRALAAAILISSAFLAGCTTITPEEQRAIDNRTCLSYGFKRKTDAYSTCLLQLELDRRAERRSRFEQMQYRNQPMLLHGGYRPLWW